MSINSHRRKVIFDISINIGASALPVAVLQLLIQPAISEKIGAEAYGLMLTLLAISQIGIGVSGNTLNNIRLLSNNEYVEKNVKGDFNFLLILSLFANCIIMFFFTWYYNNSIKFINIISTIIISCLGSINAYLVVEYRLKLNYPNILINNVWQSIGYCLGFYLFVKTGFWQIIFILGYLASVIHNLLTTTLLNEPLCITPLFAKTSRKMSFLLCAVVLSSVLTYLDRLLLYPLWGGRQVAIYYSASIVGRVLGMIAVPISSVFLSYIVKIDVIEIKKNYFEIFLILLALCLAGYFGGVLLSNFVIKILYPDLLGEAVKLVPYTIIAAIINILGVMINPLILRFSKLMWQIIIQMSYLVFYLSLSLLMMHNLGLLGFCLGVLFANILRIVIMIPISIMGIKKSNAMLKVV